MWATTAFMLVSRVASSAMTWPWRKTTMRSQTENTSVNRWLIKMTEMPSLLGARMRSSTCSTSRTASAAVGPSMMTSLGLNVSARAIATDGCWPPDNRYTGGRRSWRRRRRPLHRAPEGVGERLHQDIIDRLVVGESSRRREASTSAEIEAHKVKHFDMVHSLMLFRDSADLSDGLEPRAGGSGRFPHLERAGKFDAFNVGPRGALEASHQEAPSGGSEIVDRLRDGS